MKKKFLLVSICVLALIITLTVGMTIYQRCVPKEYVRLDEFTSISIHNDLFKNEISAIDKWENTDVIVTGTVNYIYSGGFVDDGFAMDLRYGDRVGLLSVHTSKKEILKLNRGDRVEVSGKMTYISFNDGALHISIDADEIIKQ